MYYRKVRTSRPPPLFEMRVTAGMTQLAATESVALPPPHLMPRLRDYIESLLLAENHSPTTANIARLLNSFSQLVALSQTGKPFIYKKRDTISLLFDVSALQSEMCMESPDDLVLGYTQSMMGFLLFNPEPKKIGMIGLGGGSLAKFCYRYVPHASIAVAEIDPHVIALRKHFRIPEDDERLQVRCMDGAEFLRQVENQFDVVMVDGFDKSGQPAQLCSQRFYDDCHHALMPDGIMVVNLLGDVAETDIYIDRIRVAFDDEVIVIDALDSLNKIVFACKGKLLNLPGNILKSRIQELESLPRMTLSLTVQNILLQRQSMLQPKHSLQQEDSCLSKRERSIADRITAAKTG